MFMEWRARVRSLLRPRGALDAARMMTGPASFIRYLDNVVPRPHEKQRDRTMLGVRQLGGAPLKIRRGSTDASVIRETFLGAFHRPPPGLAPRTILDLGSNIGATAADFAVRFPDACILGVELDEETAALAIENTEAWRGRCQVIHGAAAVADGTATYDPLPGFEFGVAVAEGDTGRSSAPAFALPTLLDMLVGAEGMVDYLKMDIEGAEREILASARTWSYRVRAVQVEVHPPYTRGEAEEHLVRAGFEVRFDRRHQQALLGTSPTLSSTPHRSGLRLWLGRR